MLKRLVINANHCETRIALLEDTGLAELYIERRTKRSLVGDIYLARVERVLPGMQSAFVNIGGARSAFLFAGDVLDSNMALRREQGPSDDSEADPRRELDRRPIEQLLTAGQDILVQVLKEPLGSKGPRVTMLISLAGRYLVLMPDSEHVGISRRIASEDERERLRSLMTKIKPAQMGVIIRTAAQDVAPDLLTKDIEDLLAMWREVLAEKKGASAPAALFQEPSIIIKTVRDLYADEVVEIVTDDQLVFQQLSRFLTKTIPGAIGKLRLHTKSVPIFADYCIDTGVARALGAKVWLPSGGYIVIDQTEALTSFDVNTGKYVGKDSAQDTILRTNLEAVVAIVAQIRVRNLGGIIVLDFIDMERGEDRAQVSQALLGALKADKARTKVLAINELGLVQMTRQRSSESLERVLMSTCGHCEGRGRILSAETEAYNLLRDIVLHVGKSGQTKVVVHVRRDIRSFLIQEAYVLLQKLEAEHGLELQWEEQELRPELLREAPYVLR